MSDSAYGRDALAALVVAPAAVATLLLVAALVAFLALLAIGGLLLVAALVALFWPLSPLLVYLSRRLSRRQQNIAVMHCDALLL